MDYGRKVALILALQMFLNSSSGCKTLPINLTKEEVEEIKGYYDEYVSKKEKTPFEETIVFEEPIIEEYPVSEETMEPQIIKNKFGYLNKKSDVYLNDGTSITLEKYQRVIIYDESSELYYIETFEQEDGYIAKKDITEVPDTFIEVDISSQTLNYYVDGELFLTTPVVTGKPSTPTHEGYFKINSKSRKVYLTGPTWRSYVEYWMPFDGGRGIHDASWRSKNEFNEETYLRNGSHGCVNLPVDIAPTIYENVSTETRVLVHK